MIKFHHTDIAKRAMLWSCWFFEFASLALLFLLEYHTIKGKCFFSFIQILFSDFPGRSEGSEKERGIADNHDNSANNSVIIMHIRIGRDILFEANNNINDKTSSRQKNIQNLHKRVLWETNVLDEPVNCIKCSLTASCFYYSSSCLGKGFVEESAHHS